MKIMTDREYERRLQAEVEVRMRELDERRWQAQQIDELRRDLSRNLDGLRRELYDRLAPIEKLCGIDRPTCGPEICEKPATGSVPVHLTSL